VTGPRRPRETQPERTALSWQRTGVGVLGVGALLARGALAGHQPLLLAGAGVVALLGLAVLGGVAPRRHRRLLQGAASGDVPGAGRGALGVTSVVVVVALVALAGVAVEVTR
jgi:putative membrane protein